MIFGVVMMPTEEQAEAEVVRTSVSGVLATPVDGLGDGAAVRRVGAPAEDTPGGTAQVGYTFRIGPAVVALSVSEGGAEETDMDEQALRFASLETERVRGVLGELPPIGPEEP